MHSLTSQTVKPIEINQDEQNILQHLIILICFIFGFYFIYLW
jgi:hypothetical protein